MFVSNLLDEQLIKSNVYYGEEVVNNFKQYICNNYKYQKIIFFIKEKDYSLVVKSFASLDYELITFSLKDFSPEALNEVAIGLKCDIRLLVAYGDFDIVQAVKWISVGASLPYIIIKYELPKIEELLDYGLLYDKIYKPFTCDSPVQLLLDSKSIETDTRNNVYHSLNSLVNKISFFEDYYLNFIIYKNDFDCKNFCFFKEIYLDIYNIIDKLTLCDTESVLRLGDMILYMSVVLKNLNYNYAQDKLFIFSNLYNLFCERKVDCESMLASQVVGFQVFNSLYIKFANNLNRLQFNFIDIEKRVAMFDKNFMTLDLDFKAYEFPDVERLKYVLNKNQKLILEKVNTATKIYNSFLTKSILLTEDSGYSLSKELNNVAVIKAVCFSSDILEVSFLRILRDYGVLEFFDKDV